MGNSCLFFLLKPFYLLKTIHHRKNPRWRPLTARKWQIEKLGIGPPDFQQQCNARRIPRSPGSYLSIVNKMIRIKSTQEQLIRIVNKMSCVIPVDLTK